MKHTGHRKRIKRLKRRFRRLAAALAGAAVITSAMLPGLPAATAHAAANPNAGAPVTAQQVGQDQEKNPVEVNPNASKMPIAVQPNGKAKRMRVVRGKMVADKAIINRQVSEQTKGQQQPEQDSNEQAKTQAADPSRQDQNEQAKTQAADQDRQDNKKQVTARQKAPKDFQQVLDIVATAYAPGPHDNEQWGDKTYLGTKVRPGVIAVDPDIIPLGSRVYIQFPDGTGQYAVAEDTGGAIKGNRIDIALPSVKQAEDFGIQKVKVYVLSTPDTRNA
ncbi:3D domain protein [Thermosinus carboxydivorans Nor1]|uniref:3D domain protein n=1 Tax=Thermosinus carboxydivorans Nor1 TaxID=401526 RepID=A1HM08_9FIRM|nr:3D domain-containing protein [Thermosinus carboxydivorans]EAX48859.1 3D domain protein [Thermosinus carboxydivorans Nor1]